VRDLGLRGTTGQAIFTRAQEILAIIVTFDEDFAG
jgi:predicted nuclease of predicted toxin-antitoxin system